MGSRENKSGYELRTDLLGMAMGIVGERVQRSMENEHMKPEGTRVYTAVPIKFSG